MNQHELNVVPVLPKKINKFNTFVNNKISGQHGDSNNNFKER